MKRTLYFTALGLSLFAISPAFGADGYVIGNAYLRAGPDTSYPSVAMLPAGAEVAIEGCVDGWSWCDVATGNDRGWVAGNFLQEEYQGQRVLIPEYGVRIGIPVVSFVFGTYWDDHYRNRSWYGNREHWSHITPHYRPAAAHRNGHDNMQEDASHHPRNTSVDAPRAPGREVGTASRQHELATTPSRQHKPSKPAAPQHAVAVEARSPERNAHAVKPAAQHAMNSKASVQPRGAEHKPADPNATRKPIAQKNAPVKKDENGKDEH